MQLIGCSLIHIDRKNTPHMQNDGSDIIEPMRVVGMLMGYQRCIEPVHASCEELLAQIRACVDQHRCRTALPHLLD
jgi:hypothetical protein